MPIAYLSSIEVFIVAPTTHKSCFMPSEKHATAGQLVIYNRELPAFEVIALTLKVEVKFIFKRYNGKFKSDAGVHGLYYSG